MVIYGATKQLDAYGTLQNSQLGNRQIAKNDDGSATFVLYPQSATQEEIDRIAAVVSANGWNILRSGIQSAIAPNLLTIREKGQNKNWANALSANDVTQGAPCPQSAQPSLPLPEDPPSAASHATQRHGPHRTGRRELQHRRVLVRRLPDRPSESPEGVRPGVVRHRRLADPESPLILQTRETSVNRSNPGTGSASRPRNERRVGCAWGLQVPDRVEARNTPW